MPNNTAAPEPALHEVEGTSKPTANMTGFDIIAAHWPTGTHTLKTVPPYFAHVASFDKPFEIRRDDRNFQPGDLLILAEWIPATGHDTGYFTDEKCLRKITYVMRDAEKFGVRPGYVVLGLTFVSAEDWSRNA